MRGTIDKQTSAAATVAAAAATADGEAQICGEACCC